MITGTFEYGKFFSKIGIAIWAVMVGLIYAAIVLVVCIRNEIAKEEFIVLLMFFVVFGISFTIFLVYMLIFNKFHKKQIELWKQDAILTEGIVKRLPGLLHERAFEITVSYKKGKRIVEFPSENRSKFPMRRTRYFDYLVGIKIPVLYSPKYNKVMFVDTSCADYVS